MKIDKDTKELFNQGIYLTYKKRCEELQEQLNSERQEPKEQTIDGSIVVYLSESDIELIDNALYLAQVVAGENT